MKKLAVSIFALVIGILLLGMYSVPTGVASREEKIAGVYPLPAPLAHVPPPAESGKLEVPCDGTRYDLDTFWTYGVRDGEGTGRAIGFHVDETLWITSFGILADMTTHESHDVVLYSSPDGHSAGPVIYSQTSFVWDGGWGWYDIPFQIKLEGRNYYVLNWRPTDGGYDDWADSLLYYHDDGLPQAVGPFTLLEGFEGYDANDPDNWLHAQFRICVDEPWSLCFYDDDSPSKYMYLGLSGSVIHGQVMWYDWMAGVVSGTVHNGRAFLACDYYNNGGLRFYDVDLSTRTGTTWAVSSINGEFYEEPHPCHTYPCGTATNSVSTETGAME